jgi:hypothetical protein
VADAVEIRECPIGAGDGVSEDNVDLTTELVEDLGEGEGRADGVAVRTRVRGEEEAGVSAEDCQESGDLGLVRDDLTRLGRRSLESQELGFGVHDLIVTGWVDSTVVRF